jgi:hypothetical protein
MYNKILLKLLQQCPHTNNKMPKIVQKSQNLHKITKNLVLSFGDIFVFYPLHNWPFVVSVSRPPVELPPSPKSIKHKKITHHCNHHTLTHPPQVHRSMIYHILATNKQCYTQPPKGFHQSFFLLSFSHFQHNTLLH